MVEPESGLQAAADSVREKAKAMETATIRVARGVIPRRSAPTERIVESMDLFPGLSRGLA